MTEALQHLEEGRHEEAARCCERAARLAHPAGQGLFATCLVEGEGVETDEAAAVQWAQMSADQGNTFGQ